MILTQDSSHINYQRIEKAIAYLEANFRRQPDLDEVAEKVHLSPFHFQRIFTEWAGISPKRFLQYLTVDYLKGKLNESRNIEDAAEAAGLSSQSRVYDLFTTLEAVTPLEYKSHGAGSRITFGIAQSPFGYCLIGGTERGICWMSFTTQEESVSAIREMQEQWFLSAFHRDDTWSQQQARAIFGGDTSAKIHLLVKGTNFQVKVWEALLNLRAGALCTYQDIARQINNPKAVQAVGSAVGSNHIAYLIPCHRVIRKDGILGEYRWNSARKKSIIGWEMSRIDPS